MKRLVLSLFCGLLSFSSSEAANIAFVSFHAGDNTPSTATANIGFTQAPDVGYTQLLAANGHTVTRFVSVDEFNTAALNAADLVIISRSVASGHYQQATETAAWHSLNVPTIILGGYILRGSRLGYTTGETIPDVNTSEVRLKANIPGHPIFAGVPPRLPVAAWLLGVSEARAMLRLVAWSSLNGRGVPPCRPAAFSVPTGWYCSPAAESTTVRQHRKWQASMT